MIAAHRYAYAQARLQAALAALPDESTWQRLAANRTLAAYLEEARTLPCGPWVRGFSGHNGPHELEPGLRVLYRDTVDAVAAWMPPSWREAVIWTRWWPCLPMIAHWMHRGEAPIWVQQDYLLRPLLNEQGRLTSAGLMRAGPAPLVTDEEEDLLAVWARIWRESWPRTSRDERVALETLTRLILRYGTAVPGGDRADSGAGRSRLRGRLHRFFHRSLLQPASAFTFLAIVGLDLERLRGELVTRALFAAEAV
ncbi:hypothetical protein ABC977_13515 [Thioalkalicoccus limnaeus]|uniref:Uncharacterized protein n=1 Tax=Thioalkalicoccus limnaeus TaxID=120681 RepID=A0ABV4BFV8_9GAMM